MKRHPPKIATLGGWHFVYPPYNPYFAKGKSAKIKVTDPWRYKKPEHNPKNQYRPCHEQPTLGTGDYYPTNRP